MTSDADRLAALEKQVGDIMEAVRALEKNIQAIDEALAKQARSIRYMGDQVQSIDERIRIN